MLTVNEGKQDRLMMLTKNLEHVNQHIEDLETNETHMLEKLQRSINEHNKLMSQTKLSELTLDRKLYMTNDWKNM